ncbi:tyrosine-protein phosphatase [Propioniciclava sp.]|uniref:tyrosine-protein phosphatase n=1 Tax=Propioniciclava sp. TaxID=2038686 RepID=UPI002636FD38|nr:tyrosine-protein phosphatase [Propioniciclava sp.]
MATDGAGLLNFRDLGGTPTASGRLIQPGRLWRSEMLTFLSPDDMETLIAGGLSDVIDLRTDYEVAGSPSPLRARPGVAYHHFNYFPAVDEGATLAESADWDFESHDVGTATTDDAANSFLMMLALRPDSVLAALRVIANARGAALVHCAVGRDRTGLTVALCLTLMGVPDDLIARDYELTADVMDTVIERQWSDPTYADQVGDRSLFDIRPRAASMLRLLAYLRDVHGGALPLLRSLGWTDSDQAALEAHLLGR